MWGDRCQNRLRTNSETVLKNFYRVPKVAILKVVSVVEMTSYHILLNGNFDIFRSIRSESVRAVYPAWTAIEFSGLRRRIA